MASFNQRYLAGPQIEDRRDRVTLVFLAQHDVQLLLSLL